MQKFYGFCVHAIEYLSAILFSVLAVAAFLKTAYVKNAYEIVVNLSWDNPCLNLLFILIFLGILYCLAQFLSKFKHGNTILLIITCIWVFSSSLLWSYLSKSGPSSDCGSVYYAAKQFAKNDFSALSYRDSYFSVYPFQLGLAFFYEIIFRLVGNDNFHILQGINAICLIIIVISQYHIARLFFHEKKVQLYSLLLTASCIPFIMYGSYIYGEIPSFAFLLFGFWMLVEFINKHYVIQGILGFISITFSILIRQNNLIFLIALCIVLVLFLSHNWEDLPKVMRVILPIYLICLLYLSFQIIPLVQNMYGYRSETEINKGVPNSTYLAMGLMESEAGPGYYNGFNFDTFTVTADYDSSLASEIGYSAFKERCDYFISHPAYAIHFFTTKCLNQWLNVGWAIFNSTYVSFGERLPIIESCFSGALYSYLIEYMSGFQLCLYLSTAIGCIHLINQKKNILSYTFLLTAFGGFLFYIVWEASGRYILPYGIFIFPNAGYGCYCIFNFIQSFIKKIKGLNHA